MRLLASIFAATAIFTISSCKTNDQSSVPAPVTQAISPGEAQYRQSCARCHGVFLEGNASKGTPPIDSVKLATFNDQALALTIRNGKGKMPAFPGLSQDQLNLLIAFLRTKG